MFETIVQVLDRVDVSTLDEVEAGPMLADLLSRIDEDQVSGYDRITVLRARQRMVNHYQASVYADMVQVVEHMETVDEDLELAHDAAAAEIRVALRLTRRAADSELNTATDLRARLPLLWDMFLRGDIDLRRVKTILHGTTHLSMAAARQVVEDVADQAAGKTTGELAAQLRRFCVVADPDDARDRFEHATADRRVVMQPTVDGTAELLGLQLPPDRVLAITDRINRTAKRLKTSEETRSMDQIRADVYLDILEGVNAGAFLDERGRRGVVNIVTDLETLTRLADHPGDLAGYGPVIADIARQIAETGPNQWQYTLIDGETSQVVATGTTRRRPTADQARLVRTRQPVCAFIGCRMPAAECDLDHRTTVAEGGTATNDNLEPECRHDHRIRHQFGWTHQRLSNGHIKWTTKLGHTYTSPPEDIRPYRTKQTTEPKNLEDPTGPDPP